MLNPCREGLGPVGGLTSFVAGAQSTTGGPEISCELKEGSRPTNKDFDFSPESYKEPLRYLNRIGFKNMLGNCKISFTTMWGMSWGRAEHPHAATEGAGTGVGQWEGKSGSL